jgi:RNA 2',3'-cyclic 3'-phosphodiesterase
MRLFVGIEAGHAVATATRGVIDALRVRARTLAPAARITWAAPERLHLTVRFVGEVDEHRATAIADALAAPLGLSPFDVDLAGLGVFPARGAPRVVWIGVHADLDALQTLERAIGARLALAGCPDARGAYHPHLTLARVRDPDGLRAGPWLAGLEPVAIGRIRVAVATLFVSRLLPQGAEHRALAEARLVGGRGASR